MPINELPPGTYTLTTNTAQPNSLYPLTRIVATGGGGSGGGANVYNAGPWVDAFEPKSWFWLDGTLLDEPQGRRSPLYSYTLETRTTVTSPVSSSTLQWPL